MRVTLGIVLVALIVPATAASAQDNPLTTNHRFMYGVLKAMLLRSAEQMPEEHYGFKPTEAVRTFGQIIGHVADSQYSHCSTVLGEKNPSPKVEGAHTSKAAIVATLKDAFAYCDRAYGGLTDATAADMVKSYGGLTPKLGVLTGNTIHSVEHYGNLVTYMRLKNLVPPSSDPEFMQQQRKK